MEHGARLSALRITTAVEAAARDRAVINGGVPSFDLMVQAGSAAAAFLLRELGDRLAHGVCLLAGSGNNGGDAYVMAAQLARQGVTVRVHARMPPRTPDAHRAAQLAAPYLVHGLPTGHEQIVVDGLLGTGHRGALRDGLWADCARLTLARDRGATIVALDVPSGLDATTGEIADGSAAAHVTVSFGTIKRGALLQRAHVGRVVLLDIGLGAGADRPGETDDGAWRWADLVGAGALLQQVAAADAWSAHKGTRGRVALAGGDEGMAGAIALAARAALQAGAGLVHAVVANDSVAAVQALVPQALAHRWPEAAGGRHADANADADANANGSAAAVALRVDALAVGPGLGRNPRSATVLQRLLDQYRGLPLLLDADALWHVAEAAAALGTDAASLLQHWTRDARAVVCTPHPGEFGRLLGTHLPPAWSERAALLQQFATRAQCTVLLKGTPTLVAPPDGAPLWVVPHGTPLLATGGSGDCLSGIVAALLAQGASGDAAAVLGATVHGRAAEQVHGAARATARGTTLDDVLAATRSVWSALATPPPLPPAVLAELPAV
ncbi:NAD(P)H-hydrate dehydratase [Gemmatimonas sp.]|uniref:NAD(P)H-hydrate dehydratase n=1 Tax=Gemmatimonas sp. TaxID=1962908 RepID=UPI0025B8E247|nr:NAD(P)H-hydrate dehydratase [Gemmatimonas sp.]MCA2991710.1 NAD(P)H-hydrate dehydratase [Gemmatimonas sp.]